METELVNSYTTYYRCPLKFMKNIVLEKGGCIP